MRDLASVCTIDKTWALEGKDRVQGASFKENGYEAMVGKDIQPGDLCVFIQEGAVLPVAEQWEFLRKRCYRDNLNGKEGFLIKPMKFATIKSWGLVVPLNELGFDEKEVKKLKAGQDLTERLGIWKYEPEEDASPTASKRAYPKWVKFCLSHALTRWIGRIWQKRHQNESGGFPSELISKSDETTIQNMRPSTLSDFADAKVVICAKMEGQSGTVVPVFKGKRLVGAYPCSRNNAYKLKTKNTFWEMMDAYDIVKKMQDIWRRTGKAYILQFEQVGAGIQNDIYDFRRVKWFLYTVKDFETKKQLSYTEMVKVADMLGVEVVPLVATGKLGELMPTIEAAVAYAENVWWEPAPDAKVYTFINCKGGKPGMSLWKNCFQHEGVVVRTEDYDKDAGIGLSFKVKNLEYAEKGLGKIHELCMKVREAEKK